MLIEAKVKVTRKVDNKYRKTVETYVMDREFFSHVEYCITHLLEAEMETHGGTIFDFELVSMKQSSIKEIDEESFDDSMPSFLVSLRDNFVDDDGNEKKIRYKILIWAPVLTAANARASEIAQQGYDMLIEGIKQVDYIYLHNAEEGEEG